MSISLNEKQILTINKINKFILQDNEKIFYLFGYAGTGKTFLISKIINDFLLSAKIDHISICAPTHQALDVIQSYFKSIFSNNKANLLSKINFMTIHKMLEFKPIILTENGSKVFKSVRESKYFKRMERKLIILDECSMISEEMMKSLNKYIDLYPIKIIFMGDELQLPPVTEVISMVFRNIPKNYEFYILLDQIMRTGSSEIKEALAVIRKWNCKDNLWEKLVDIHKKKRAFKLYHRNSNHLATTWFKYFIKKVNNGTVPIILTWKNIVSDKYNEIIRKYIHQTDDLDDYKVNDHVVFNNYYGTLDKLVTFRTADMVKILRISYETKILYNWKELIITEPKTIITKEFNTLIDKFSKNSFEIKVDILVVEKINKNKSSVSDTDKNNMSIVVRTIHRPDLEKYGRMLKTVEEHIKHFFKKFKSADLTSKLWDIYHKKLVDPYAVISFGYSITTYKSQGSTFKSVLVDVADIIELHNMNDFQKALYTAAGRASDELGFIL